MRTAGVLVVSSILFICSCQPVPGTGRRQLQLIPRSQLHALANESYEQVLDSYEVVTGTAQAQMVERVGQRIRRAVESYFADQGEINRLADFEWEFTLLRDTMINAWAMPGGKVGIFTGILPVTRDENGLAVVMGHEIAHAVAGHGNERMSQILLVQLGGLALSEALKTRPEETRNLALAAFGVGVQVGVLLPYSRLHETEADRLGLNFMALAGYDPRPAVEFWQRMSATRRNGAPPEFLSTHPSDRTRIRNLERMMPEALEYYRRGQGGSGGG